LEKGRGMVWFDSPRPSGRQSRRPQICLNLEALESRQLLDAAANLNFVAQAYRDLLHREADPAGLAAFTGALNAGAATRDQVALAIQGSTEYHADQVQSLFQALLHRPADPVGLAGFTAFLNAGGTAELAGALIAG